MKTDEDVFLFLLNRGYKEFKHWKDDARSFQKRFDGEIVCDCNDANFINVLVYNFNTLRVDNRIPNIEVELVAEKFKQWWNLRCYGLTPQEVIDGLESIEKKLIGAFESIAGGSW